jgi:hypothetical protein
MLSLRIIDESGKEWGIIKNWIFNERRYNRVIKPLRGPQSGPFLDSSNKMVFADRARENNLSGLSQM